MCRENLARSRGLTTCSELNLTRERPPCELKEPADTMALKKVAALSGDIEVMGVIANIIIFSNLTSAI